jgi:hypothetical protein
MAGVIDFDIQLRVLIVQAVEVLRRLGFEAEARKLSTAPIRAENRYGCAARALFQVELSLRADYAATLHGSLQPHPRAIEAVSLVRLALDAIATARGSLEAPSGRWLETLRGRLGVLLLGRDPGDGISPAA